jgi:hypothetical protein
MKTRIQTSLCAAIAAGATAIITAQTPAPQTTSSPQAAPASSERTVTITGCLKEAPSATASNAAGTASTAGTTASGTTATGTAGTAVSPSAAPEGPTYILANATMAPAPAGDASGGSTASATGTSGTTASSAAGTAGSMGAQTYRLMANGSALAAHVGKKLELTGVIENQSGASSGTASATAAGTPTASGDATGPALRVQSGKIVANSCTP